MTNLDALYRDMETLRTFAHPVAMETRPSGFATCFGAVCSRRAVVEWNAVPVCEVHAAQRWERSWFDCQITALVDSVRANGWEEVES